jgi:hypothetical protein
MKAILLILVVAAALAAAYYQQSASKSSLALGKAFEAYESLKEDTREQIAAVNLERAEAIAHSTDLGAQVASLQKQLAEARNNSVTDELLARQMDRDNAAAAQAEADARAKAANRTEAEKQLARDQALQVYNRNKAAIDEQRASLTAKLTAMRSAMETKQDNPPTFTEQGTTIRNGERFSSGVRMSQADRDVIIKKHEGEVAAIAAQIGVAEGEMVRIDTRAKELETAYAAALVRLQ